MTSKTNRSKLQTEQRSAKMLMEAVDREASRWAPSIFFVVRMCGQECRPSVKHRQSSRRPLEAAGVGSMF